MKKGYLFIAITTLLFSSMEIALKFVAGQFNPIQLTFSRFFVGGLVLLPFALHMLHKKQIRLRASALPGFALLGFIGIFISMTLYQLAVLYTKASAVAVLFSSNPLFVTLFAFLLLREPISKHQVAGLVLDVIGILIIINPFNTQLDPRGVCFVLLSTLLFSLYGVLGKKKCREYGGLVVTCFGFLFGSLEMAAVALLSHLDSVAGFLSAHGLDLFANIPFFSGYTPANLPVILHIFIGVTGIGFACYFMSMEVSSAGQTSLVFFFKPALAPLLAFLILHEEIPPLMLLGIGFILCGSLVSLLPALLKKEIHPQNNPGRP